MLYVFGRFAVFGICRVKTVDGLQRVVEFLSFKDGLLEILDSPIFMPESFWVDVRELFDDEIKG